jgi:translation initiation factor 4A
MLVMRALGDYLSIKFLMCIGGTSVRDDQRKLEEGVQVLVGTPGRVNDLIQRGALSKFRRIHKRIKHQIIW